jgi:predicted flap endonuclease-1-like 5' DNA nuclease
MGLDGTIGLEVAIGLALSLVAIGLVIGWLIWGRSRRKLSEQIVTMYNRLTASDIERERLLDELAALPRGDVVKIDLRSVPEGAGEGPGGGMRSTRDTTDRDSSTRSARALRGQSSPAHDMVVVLDELETRADLEQVKGIGPKIAVLLAAEGITNLRRLANLSDDALDHLGVRLPAVAERVRREGWREQARDLLADSVGQGEQVANHAGSGTP